MDSAFARTRRDIVDQPVLEPLVIPFLVIVRDKLRESPWEVPRIAFRVPYVDVRTSAAMIGSSRSASASSMLRRELTPYQGLCCPWEDSFRPRCAGGE
jgi:hypothetical protein